MKKTFTIEEVQDFMGQALRRHTWMKDGVTYVGNGTFTFKQAQVMMEKDYQHIFNPENE